MSASPCATPSPHGDAVALSPGPGQAPLLHLQISGGEIALVAADLALNRFWLRLIAEPAERVWGAGEQMSYLDLRGRRFPLWTSEPGVGRDKSTLLTFQAESTSKSGGDYWNTNYPQPTYLSSRRYALHLDTTAFAAFDFRDLGFHEVEAWETPRRIELFAERSLAGLVGTLSTRFGRPPRLPDWAFSGAILGLKDGQGQLRPHGYDHHRRRPRLRHLVRGLGGPSARPPSAGGCIWDWRANEERYPGLRQRVSELHDRGIRFMGYVNPYLAVDGALYAEARDAGHLALRLDADLPYIVDFGEFDCGIVDFTSPAAADWFAHRVIGREMLDFGLSGWMADFGEYLPTDVRLASGMDGMLAHNAWPVLWAEVNAKAVASRGGTGEAVFFMRAGWTGVSGLCPLMWAGDQSVDFSRHDGIGTVIRAALSAGLVGNAYHHSDLGGYTSLFGNVRTPDLMMRWSELAAFCPVMRSHEGNRPEDNLQIDGEPAVLAHFVRMTQVHSALAPYVATLCDEAVRSGLPLQRPLFIEFEDDDRAAAVETAYMYGPDLLIAPVIEAGRTDWPVYLPRGADWIHLWTAQSYVGGQDVTVACPFGHPPVFFRADATMRPLFEAMGGA